MSGRTFNGTNAFISGSIGDMAATTEITIAAICSRAANGATHLIWNGNTALNSPRLALYFNSSNQLVFETNAGNASSSSFTVQTTDGWTFVCGRKAAGTVTATLSKYSYSAGTFTHQSGTGNTADVTAGNTPTGWQIGKYSSIGWYNGSVLLVGVWKRELGQDEIERLPFSLKAWLAARPNGLLYLNQADTGTNVLDITGGGGSQTGITGTTVATTSVPIFNRGGEVMFVRSGVAAVTAPFPPFPAFQSPLLRM